MAAAVMTGDRGRKGNLRGGRAHSAFCGEECVPHFLYGPHTHTQSSSSAGGAKGCGLCAVVRTGWGKMVVVAAR